LAKLRLHTDSSLGLLESTTELLGKAFRIFEERTCLAFDTYELKREAEARQRRQAKNSSTCPPSSATTATKSVVIEKPSIPDPIVIGVAPTIPTAVTTSSSSKSFTGPALSSSSSSLAALSLSPPSTAPSSGQSAKVSKKGKGKTAVEALVGRCKKVFNRRTYKNHSLGDYVRIIKMYGTTDSYSTEGVGPFFHHKAAHIY
jgi:hypothetical protein